MSEHNESFINHQRKKISPSKKLLTKIRKRISHFPIDGRVATDPRLSLETKGFYFLWATLEELEGHECTEGLELVWNEDQLRYVNELAACGYVGIEEVSE